MKVEFDTNAFAEIINLWQEAIDMEIPMKDEFKIHFMKNRRSMLEKHVVTAAAWSLMLSAMVAVDDPAGLEQAKQVVKGFKTWAEEELQKIGAL